MKKSLLKSIDNYFVGHSTSGMPHEWWGDTLLWPLVSAMRGPDSSDEQLKKRTTRRIRNAVAPNYFDYPETTEEPDKPFPHETIFNFCPRIASELQGEFPSAQEHFLGHYAWACWVYWELKNNEETTTTS